MQVSTHQYSATHFERDLSKGTQDVGSEGIHVAHTMTGIPGAFFNFEISPILVVHTETRQSFAHFLTSYVSKVRSGPARLTSLLRRTCAIVGGVLTIASIIDSVLFATSRRLKKSAGPAPQSYGNGKLM